MRGLTNEIPNAWKNLEPGGKTVKVGLRFFLHEIKINQAGGNRAFFPFADNAAVKQPRSSYPR